MITVKVMVPKLSLFFCVTGKTWQEVNLTIKSTVEKQMISQKVKEVSCEIFAVTHQQEHESEPILAEINLN